MKRLIVLLVTFATALAMIGVVPATAAHDANGTVCIVGDPDDFEQGGFNDLAQAGLQSGRATTPRRRHLRSARHRRRHRSCDRSVRQLR